MKQRLTIVIFDGSFKTTPFINRLAEGLATKHQVYILGFNEGLSHPILGVTYVPLGSNQNKLRFFFTTIRLSFLSNKLNLVISTYKKIFQGKRILLHHQNLALSLQHISPDIIHLQWPSVIPWFEDVLSKQEIPVVLSQRGFHNNVRPFVEEKNFQYLKRWYPEMAGFHSVSKAISAEGDKVYSSATKIDQVIYTGIDLESVSFSKHYIKSKKIQLLSVGRPHWKKGYNYALQTCAILKKNKIPFEYTIIGGATNEELQFMISDLGLIDLVLLKDKVSQEGVFQLMRTSSILLLPSTEEGIANVVVEAMALGLPVISTDCGGVPELIDDGVNGWLVPTRDAKAMAEAIVTFLDLSLEEIEKVRIAARRKVELQHNEEQMIKGMENLYKNVSKQPEMTF